MLIPSGTVVTPSQPYRPEILKAALQELCTPSRDFTGVISVTSADNSYLLFLFRSTPYAAGKSIGEKPFSLSLHDFFAELAALPVSGAALAVHATDPVLLKCLLIFIQDNLTAKAPVSLINLEAVLGQIQQEAADALIILEKQGMFNFFFFKDGSKGKCYYADPDTAVDDTLPIDEQMLVYAYQGNDVDALIYRNISTRESSDADTMGIAEMFSLLKGSDAAESTIATKALAKDISEAEILEDDLLLAVTEGPLKGQLLSGNIPCVIGRKDTDIVINDPMVSKTHAAVQIINGTLLLVDLNSTNGTFINGRRIQKHELRVNDDIQIGASRIKVQRLNQP